MRALYLHISGLVGLLMFLKEVLNYAPLERTILVSATTGLTVYLMLIVGHTIVHQIMTYSPPTDANAGNASDETVAASDSQANGSPQTQQVTTTNQSASNDAAAPVPESPSSESATSTAPEAPSATPPTEAPEAPAPPDRAAQADRSDPTPSDSLAQTSA